MNVFSRHFKGGINMARKSIEPNISFDDVTKTYYVCFDYGKDEDGKRVKKYKSYGKVSDARKALREFTADKTKGLIIIPRETTLAEWMEYYLNDIIKPNRELTTLYGYLNIANKYIIPELGKTPVQQITPTQIQKYYSKLGTQYNLSSNTIGKHHDLLKSALKIAVLQDKIVRNPLDRVEPPKQTNREINFYSVQQLNDLLRLVKGHRIEIIVYLAVLLGLRREEICGLQWSNIDFENRIIRIREAKTMAGSIVIKKDPKNKTSGRSLFITDELYEVLLEEKERQKKNAEFFGKAYNQNDFVTKWENGTEYLPNYLSDSFAKFIKKNKLPKITLHGLRHSFVTAGNSVGATMYNLSKVAGHSTPDITGRIYTHLEDETHEDLLKSIAKSLFRKNQK